MEFLSLLLTVLSIREWQGAYASSGGIVTESNFAEAGRILCQEFEDERRATLKLDSNPTTASASTTSLGVDLDMQGNWEMIALAAAQGKARELCDGNVQFHGDRAHARQALQIDGMLLQCASPEFKADEGLVSVAVKQNGCAFEFSDQQLRSDPDFVDQTLAHNGLALLFASKRLQCDPCMQRDALRGGGWDWLLAKIRDGPPNDFDSSALPEECFDLGADDEPTSKTFVAGGVGLACLDALWPIVSDGPLICDATTTSAERVDCVVLVVMGCFVLASIWWLTHIWSKAFLTHDTEKGKTCDMRIKDGRGKYHALGMDPVPLEAFDDNYEECKACDMGIKEDHSKRHRDDMDPVDLEASSTLDYKKRKACNTGIKHHGDDMDPVDLEEFNR